MNQPSGLQIAKHVPEYKAESGNIIGLACGPLKKQRYINPKIETELVEFKKEIEDKFNKSKLRVFKFPLVKEKLLPNPRRSSHNNNADSTIDRTDQSPSLHNSSQGSI